MILSRTVAAISFTVLCAPISAFAASHHHGGASAGGGVPADALAATREIYARLWVKCGEDYFVSRVIENGLQGGKEHVLTEYTKVDAIGVVGGEYLPDEVTHTFRPSLEDRLNGVEWRAMIWPHAGAQREIRLTENAENFDPSQYRDGRWSPWHRSFFGDVELVEFYKEGGNIKVKSSGSIEDYIESLPKLPECSEIPK
jgi:hypothetical protein